MDLNKVQLIGRLTRDPEVRTTPNGAQVASFSIATSFNWTDQSGQKKEQTEFHNVVAWRKLAEIIGQYLKKGSQVYIEGRLQTRSWDDKTSGQKRYRTEVVADNMIMLGRPGTGSSQGGASGPSEPVEQPSPTDSLPEIQIDNSDIPF
jgi:single-strand DNA-binding protein